jgi:hypothetical protein
MALRYPLAVALAYVVFLGLMALWLRRFRLRTRIRPRERGGVDVDLDVFDVPVGQLWSSPTPEPDLTGFGGGGGFSGGGGGASWARPPSDRSSSIFRSARPRVSDRADRSTLSLGHPACADCAMSARHLAHDDETLAEGWRSFADHASVRVQAVCLGIGALGVGSLALLDSFRIPALLSVVAGCFGVFSLARQRTLLAEAKPTRWLRLLGLAASMVAALSALAAGLLVLRAIFGGSLEVMRR